MITLCLLTCVSFQAEKLRSQYRSIDELMEDFEQMNVNVETDVEIMQKLVNQYNDSRASIEERTMALQDLEYYAHQVCMV